MLGMQHAWQGPQAPAIFWAENLNGTGPSSKTDESKYVDLKETECLGADRFCEHGDERSSKIRRGGGTSWLPECTTISFSEELHSTQSVSQLVS
jgi:hypothetical protein